jgi:uncharacterized protein
MRKTYLAVCLLIVVAVARPATAQTADDPALTADIVKLLDVLHATSIAEQIGIMVSQQMVEGIKRTHPDVPERRLSITAEVVKSKYSAGLSEQGSLLSRLVPIYAKYYTREEIQALTAFYQSTVGRKSISLMPTLMQESMVIGQQWASEMDPAVRAEIARRLRQEGIQ